MFRIFGALAEFERNVIRERTRAGLSAARTRGREGGRPRKVARPRSPYCRGSTTSARGLELTRIRGHRTLWKEGVLDAGSTPAEAGALRVPRPKGQCSDGQGGLEQEVSPVLREGQDACGSNPGRHDHRSRARCWGRARSNRAPTRRYGGVSARRQVGRLTGRPPARKAVAGDNHGGPSINGSLIGRAECHGRRGSTPRDP